MTALISLFISSLLASTLFPGGVEGFLYYLYQSNAYSLISLLAVSTAGNTLGGIITYGMGALLHRGLLKAGWRQNFQRFFKLNDVSLGRIRRWGVPALLFSWAPLVGDPLCLAAGYIRLPFWACASAIFAGKLARYSILLWLFSQPWSSPPG